MAQDIVARIWIDRLRKRVDALEAVLISVTTSLGNIGKFRICDDVDDARGSRGQFQLLIVLEDVNGEAGFFRRNDASVQTDDGKLGLLTVEGIKYDRIERITS